MSVLEAAVVAELVAVECGTEEGTSEMVVSTSAKFATSLLDVNKIFKENVIRLRPRYTHKAKLIHYW